MLVCNISMRPARRVIAADLAEVATADDATTTGFVVFATLIDDPAAVTDIVDAYLGAIMLEAGSAADTLDATTGTAPSYTGPGDIVSGAAAWWGLRAYTTASIGTNLIRLRRSSDNAEQDFASDSSGGVDVAAIATFKGAANVFVTKLYDQTGNGFDLVNATASEQPALLLASLGSLPTYKFDPTSGPSRMRTAGNMTVAQPFTMSVVCNYVNQGSQQRILNSSDRCYGFNLFGNNEAFMYVGTSVPTASGVTGGAWHAHQAVFNHPSSSVYVDGTSTSMNLGSSNGIIGTQMEHNYTFMGVVSCGEAGIWPVAFNSTQQSNMNSNQHSYWGF